MRRGRAPRIRRRRSGSRSACGRGRARPPRAAHARCRSRGGAGARRRAGLVLLGHTEIALPAGAGALTGLFVAAVARGERGALVARLIGQRSAYQIPEVVRAAERMACMAPPPRAGARADPPRLRRRGHRAGHARPRRHRRAHLRARRRPARSRVPDRLRRRQGASREPGAARPPARLDDAQPALQPRHPRAAPAHRHPAHARVDRRVAAARDGRNLRKSRLRLDWPAVVIQPTATHRPRRKGSPMAAPDSSVGRNDDSARARGEEQAQEELAARGHVALHGLRDGRRGHARPGLELRRPDVLLDRRPVRFLPAAVRVRDERARDPASPRRAVRTSG